MIIYKGNYLRIIYLISFLIAFSNLNAQKKSEEFIKIIKGEISKSEKEKKIEVLLESYLKKKNSLQYAYDLSAYSFWLYKIDINKAIIYSKKTIAITESLTPYNKVFHIKNLVILGFYYKKINNYYNSNNVYQKIVTLKGPKKYTAKAYFELGRNFNKIGDFYLAIEYLDKAILQYKNQKLYRLELKAIFEIIYAHQTLRGEENIDKGIKNLLRADSLKSHLSFSTYDEYFINERLGNLYNSDASKFDPLFCLKYYKKALKIALEGKNNRWISNVYNDIGNIYNDIDLDSAMFYFNKAQQYPHKNKILKTRTLLNKGLLFISKKEYPKAITTLETAIDSLDITIRNKIPVDLGEPVLKLEQKDLLLRIFKSLGISLLFESENQSKNLHLFLNQSLNYFKYADRLIDEIKLENSQIKSKLFWREQASDLYINIVHIYTLLNQPKNAYHYIEKNKALLLLEDATRSQFMRIANIPDSIQRQEFLLKRTIAKTKNAIINLKNSDSEDSLKIDLFDQREKFNFFINSLKNQYPEYYYSKKTAQILPLKKVKEHAQKHDLSFIQYIINDNKAFGLLITKKHTKLFQIKDVKSLHTKVKIFNNLVSRTFVSKNDKETYFKLGHDIYTQLFPEDIRAYLTHKITIIPDYILQTIPFEALILDKKKYLIEDYEINYAYSISFLEQNRKLKRTWAHDFLGFAPVSYANQLPALSNSKTEITKIAANFKSTLFLQNQATKKKFINQLSNYKIIHLSTHADANDSITPWIATHDDKITLNDIYATKNNAELVVLSACNTSIGTIQKGEGIMSLARGFFNTGANSVVSTLWKADDKSTLELTTDFYKNLKNGKPKSTSLRLAKLNYLKNHSLSDASPYYWSSLILIGDPDAIYTSNTLWVFILILLLIPLIIFFYKKITKK